MRQYQVTTKDGKVKKVSHIGVNYNNGVEKDDVISSYNKPFDNEDDIIVERGGTTYHCRIGDIKEAYIMLRNSIASKCPRNTNEYINCVQEVMLAYFGNYYGVNDRIKFWDKKDTYLVSDLAYKNSASGIERAMLAQNLLCEIDVKSTYKISMITIDGKPMIHAYNIISYDNKNYIFDSSIPSIKDGLISPIICEIPAEVYDIITLPTSSDGISIEVDYFNPLQNKDITLVYDANRESTYKKGVVKIKKR